MDAAESRIEHPSRVAYPNAPITEAVLDIRTRLPEIADLSSLEKTKDAEYSLQGTPIQFHFEFGNGPSGPSASHGINLLGFAYKSTDARNIFQVRRDGFTYNRLAPYTDWKQFAAEGQRLWRGYRDSVQPEAIELLSLTYINRLSLPAGALYEEYFRAYLNIPSALPQQVSSYSWSFQVAAEESGGQLQISQFPGQSLDAQTVTLMLHITASKIINRSLSQVSEDEIWTIFENLRRVKNRAFEACITDKAREGFY